MATSSLLMFILVGFGMIVLFAAAVAGQNVFDAVSLLERLRLAHGGHVDRWRRAVLGMRHGELRIDLHLESTSLGESVHEVRWTYTCRHPSFSGTSLTCDTQRDDFDIWERPLVATDSLATATMPLALRVETPSSMRIGAVELRGQLDEVMQLLGVDASTTVMRALRHTVGRDLIELRVRGGALQMTWSLVESTSRQVMTRAVVAIERHAEGDFAFASALAGILGEPLDAFLAARVSTIDERLAWSLRRALHRAVLEHGPAALVTEQGRAWALERPADHAVLVLTREVLEAHRAGLDEARLLALCAAAQAAPRARPEELAGEGVLDAGLLVALWEMGAARFAPEQMLTLLEEYPAHTLGIVTLLRPWLSDRARRDEALERLVAAWPALPHEVANAALEQVARAGVAAPPDLLARLGEDLLDADRVAALARMHRALGEDGTLALPAPLITRLVEVMIKRSHDATLGERCAELLVAHGGATAARALHAHVEFDARVPDLLARLRARVGESIHTGALSLAIGGDDDGKLSLVAAAQRGDLSASEEE